jgi:uncharacterized damage-inducible protein DinB
MAAAAAGFTATDLLVDGFDRVKQTVHSVLDSADGDALAYRPDAQANSIAWLIWHLTRVQDDHISELAGAEQTWTADGWADRFGLPFEPGATGYSHDTDEVAALGSASKENLGGYYDAVHERTMTYLATIGASDFDRVVDTNWDPPVTLAVRLISVINDDTQHVGQAAYVLGLAQRR